MSTEDLQRNLSLTLGQAVESLLEKKTPQGHWGDVRSTAVASWALAEMPSDPSHPTSVLRDVIHDAQVWLVGQTKQEEGGRSWDSEAWDTSLAIISLATTATDAFAERLDQARAWLQRIRCANTGTWYDEIWETTLCTIAVLRAEGSRRGPRQSLSQSIVPTIRWLNDLPSKPSGEFINPHYSGFIAWLLAELYASRALTDSLQSTHDIQQFMRKVDDAVAWLISTASLEPKELWCPYTFANAYASYGLSKIRQFRPHEGTYIEPLSHWFSRQQGTDGSFEDTEDTALAVLALSKMLASTENYSPGLLPKFSSAMARSSQECFFGYTGGSTSLALALKDFLGQLLPALTIRDWRWESQPRHVLYSELDIAASKCHMAVFLVTKDDETKQAGTLISSPRDNIVFEVGFFAARLGMENTILLVEEGTKLPTDWGGIPYIPFKDRDDLSKVHGPLLARLRHLLAGQE
jgi:Predicted nucleotide-binding protein containing TIR-like domain/A-macroglobulin TED domain